ncbi:2Fe-2S iron-sulfur cluster-binding protein [Marinomonas sp. THO17]|uniref:2Fe-2S iron-sulfur cluster-binding protein n=1 Tax=Marinomonas sp. THO17 TaxID=3149048 RepID=UPI00336C1878
MPQLKRISLSFLEPQETLQASTEESILDALLIHHVAIRHACDNGVCGVCLTQLLDGQIDYGQHHPRGLTQQEIEQNYILPCIARCKTDIRLAQPKVKMR